MGTCFCRGGSDCCLNSGDKFEYDSRDRWIYLPNVVAEVYPPTKKTKKRIKGPKYN